MATGKCNECGYQPLATSAATCPKCGNKKFEVVVKRYEEVVTCERCQGRGEYLHGNVCIGFGKTGGVRYGTGGGICDVCRGKKQVRYIHIVSKDSRDGEAPPGKGGGRGSLPNQITRDTVKRRYDALFFLAIQTIYQDRQFC